MIRPGLHAVTKRPRVEVSCDAPGCHEAHYAPEECGQHHAGVLAARVGWEIGPYMNGQPTPALCPTHATTTETCTHEIKYARTLDGVPTCGWCGRRRDAPVEPAAQVPRIFTAYRAWFAGDGGAA